MTYRRDTLLYYFVGRPEPQYCVAIGGTLGSLERVQFIGDHEPAVVGPEQVKEVAHCPGMLDQLQGGAADIWIAGHDAGVESAMEGLRR